MEEEPQERQLNIHLDPENLAGVYANFANVSFSDYEFTLTFARIDHEVEEGDVPGVVVARINMSPRFMRAHRRHERQLVEVVHARGDQEPAGAGLSRVLNATAIPMRFIGVGCVPKRRFDQMGGSGSPSDVTVNCFSRPMKLCESLVVVSAIQSASAS